MMLYLIRGVSGSGKSTLAEHLAYCMKAEHFEADMFYGENYDWSPEKLAYAHGKCFDSTRIAMVRGRDVVVSNTFCNERDLNKYIELANQHNYQYTVIVVENRSNTKNIHNVPEAVLEKQEKALRNSLKLRG